MLRKMMLAFAAAGLLSACAPGPVAMPATQASEMLELFAAGHPPGARQFGPDRPEMAFARTRRPDHQHRPASVTLDGGALRPAEGDRRGAGSFHGRYAITPHRQFRVGDTRVACHPRE